METSPQTETRQPEPDPESIIEHDLINVHTNEAYALKLNAANTYFYFVPLEDGSFMVHFRPRRQV